jgi:hypothetical protein
MIACPSPVFGLFFGREWFVEPGATANDPWPAFVMGGYRLAAGHTLAVQMWASMFCALMTRWAGSLVLFPKVGVI